MRGLVVNLKSNKDAGGSFPVQRTRTVFGRNIKCEIRISIPTVAEKHCIIFSPSGQPAFLRNLDQSLKTLVNGNIIKSDYLLNHMDVISIEGRNFRWQYPVTSKFYSGYDDDSIGCTTLPGKESKIKKNKPQNVKTVASTSKKYASKVQGLPTVKRLTASCARKLVLSKVKETPQRKTSLKLNTSVKKRECVVRFTTPSETTPSSTLKKKSMTSQLTPYKRSSMTKTNLTPARTSVNRLKLNKTNDTPSTMSPPKSVKPKDTSGGSRKKTNSNKKGVTPLKSSVKQSGKSTLLKSGTPTSAKTKRNSKASSGIKESLEKKKKRLLDEAAELKAARAAKRLKLGSTDVHDKKKTAALLVCHRRKSMGPLLLMGSSPSRSKSQGRPTSTAARQTSPTRRLSPTTRTRTRTRRRWTPPSTIELSPEYGLPTPPKRVCYPKRAPEVDGGEEVSSSMSEARLRNSLSHDPYSTSGIISENDTSSVPTRITSTSGITSENDAASVSTLKSPPQEKNHSPDGNSADFTLFLSESSTDSYEELITFGTLNSTFNVPSGNLKLLNPMLPKEQSIISPLSQNKNSPAKSLDDLLSRSSTFASSASTSGLKQTRNASKKLFDVTTDKLLASSFTPPRRSEFSSPLTKSPCSGREEKSKQKSRLAKSTVSSTEDLFKNKPASSDYTNIIGVKRISSNQKSYFDVTGIMRKIVDDDSPKHPELNGTDPPFDASASASTNVEGRKRKSRSEEPVLPSGISPEKSPRLSSKQGRPRISLSHRISSEKSQKFPSKPGRPRKRGPPASNSIRQRSPSREDSSSFEEQPVMTVRVTRASSPLKVAKQLRSKKSEESAKIVLATRASISKTPLKVARQLRNKKISPEKSPKLSSKRGRPRNRSPSASTSIRQRSPTKKDTKSAKEPVKIFRATRGKITTSPIKVTAKQPKNKRSEEPAKIVLATRASMSKTPLKVAKRLRNKKISPEKSPKFSSKPGRPRKRSPSASNSFRQRTPSKGDLGGAQEPTKRTRAARGKIGKSPIKVPASEKHGRKPLVEEDSSSSDEPLTRVRQTRGTITKSPVKVSAALIQDKTKKRLSSAKTSPKQKRTRTTRSTVFKSPVAKRGRAVKTTVPKIAGPDISTAVKISKKKPLVEEGSSSSDEPLKRVKQTRGKITKSPVKVSAAFKPDKTKKRLSSAETSPKQKRTRTTRSTVFKSPVAKRGRAVKTTVSKRAGPDISTAVKISKKKKEGNKSTRRTSSRAV